MPNWTKAVAKAAARTSNNTSTRQQLLEKALDTMVVNVGSVGETPHQAVSRVLQELRDAGRLTFLDDQGSYQWHG